MKVFYNTVDDPLKMLEKSGNKIEELELPKHVLEKLHTDIKTSTKILPPSARKHQAWTIGLLNR